MVGHASGGIGSVLGWFPDADEAALPKPSERVLAVAHSGPAPKYEQYEVPKHEEEYDYMKELYNDGGFVDDMSGNSLSKDLVIKARMLELGFFRICRFTRRSRVSQE